MINFFDITNAVQFCESARPALRIVAILIWGIKVVVPILLIVMGMLDFAKAVTEKKEEQIKAAQKILVQRAIAAVCVFLVVTLVPLVMNIIGDDSYSTCWECIEDGWNCK